MLGIFAHPCHPRSSVVYVLAPIFLPDVPPSLYLPDIMTPKTELVLASIIFFILLPVGLWGVRRDLREGETTITGMWTPPWKPISRAENPSGFRQRIFYFVFDGVVAFVVGVLYVYDALRHL